MIPASEPAAPSYSPFFLDLVQPQLSPVAAADQPRCGLAKDQLGDVQRDSEWHASPRSPIAVATAHTLSTGVRESHRAPTRQRPREDRTGFWSAGCDRWGRDSKARCRRLR